MYYRIDRPQGSPLVVEAENISLAKEYALEVCQGAIVRRASRSDVDYIQSYKGFIPTTKENK